MSNKYTLSKKTLIVILIVFINKVFKAFLIFSMPFYCLKYTKQIVIAFAAIP